MTIVLGYDAGPAATSALQVARTESLRRGLPLVVVRVVGVPSEENRHQFQQWRGEIRRIRQSAAELQQELEADGIQGRVDVHLASLGNPTGRILLDTAAAEQATLIVIGLQARSRVGKILMGSAAQEVLLGADCAVLAVKAGWGSNDP